VFFAIILVQSLGLSRTAGLMPKLISIVGIVLCVLVLLQGFIKAKATVTENSEAKKAGTTEDKKQGDWQEMAKAEEDNGLPLYATILISIGYLGLFILLGFPVASIAVMLVLPFLLNYRKYIVMIPVAIVSSLAIYFSFVYFFHITLPTGLVFQFIAGKL
jgi:hypothetical protein